MAQHIGKPNCKHTTDDNPYGAGEQSGKQAKPDTHFAAAYTVGSKSIAMFCSFRLFSVWRFME
jgi:hypothetical protein